MTRKKNKVKAKKIEKPPNTSSVVLPFTDKEIESLSNIPRPILSFFETINFSEQMPERKSKGLFIRLDYFQAMKIIAAQEGRTLYNVAEEAFEQYLKRYQEKLKKHLNI